MRGGVAPLQKALRTAGKTLNFGMTTATEIYDKMKLTALEIDGYTYRVASVGINDHPCDECALRDICSHDGSLDTWLERLCADALSENDCFIPE